ncbi:MAG: hypothetical protein Q4P84_00305, partial [Elusimicrobiales bacterium]|nr:hypothetical protein [Elusimicrobiales bacterium]
MAEKYELDPVTGKYPDLYETNMPEAPDDFDNLLDMTADLQGYWDQYLTYKKAGNTVAANQVLVAHPKLKQCFWNAEKANQIIHGLLATQRTIHDNLDVWLNKKVNNEILIH